MKKYLYLFVGIVITIWSIIGTVWFYEDVIYLFDNPSSNTSLVRTVGMLLSWFFGIVYLWFGLKPKKINVFSSWSIVVLTFSPIISLILMSFACFNVGASCPEYTHIFDVLFRPVFAYGIFISFILVIFSLFKKNKEIL